MMTIENGNHTIPTHLSIYGGANLIYHWRTICICYWLEYICIIMCIHVCVCECASCCDHLIAVDIIIQFQHVHC